MAGVDFKCSPLLEELVSALPADAAAYKRRLALAREAVERLRPHLTSGKPDTVQPQDLAAIFLALDLFVLDSRYSTAFEQLGCVRFAWCVVGSTGGPEAFLRRYAETHQGMDWHELLEEALLEFHVAPNVLLVSPLAPAEDDLLARLLGAMLRLMVLAAAISAEDTLGAGLATAARIYRRLRQ